MKTFRGAARRSDGTVMVPAAGFYMVNQVPEHLRHLRAPDVPVTVIKSDATPANQSPRGGRHAAE